MYLKTFVTVMQLVIALSNRQETLHKTIELLTKLCIRINRTNACLVKHTAQQTIAGWSCYSISRCVDPQITLKTLRNLQRC